MKASSTSDFLRQAMVMSGSASDAGDGDGHAGPLDWFGRRRHAPLQRTDARLLLEEKREGRYQQADLDEAGTARRRLLRPLRAEAAAIQTITSTVQTADAYHLGSAGMAGIKG